MRTEYVKVKIQDIEDAKDIGRSVSMVDTAGQMVVNKEFGKGYRNFKTGTADPKSYVWKCLSAVSDRIGQTICNNVERYVDVVSDVDLCKIKSLMSMMQIFGLNYEILREYDMIPNEIVDLINLFSINKKYFFQDGYMKGPIVSAMYESGVLSGGVDYECGVVEGNYDRRMFSVEGYRGFLSSVYSEFMLDVILKEYETGSNCYVLTDVFGSIEDDSNVSYTEESPYNYDDRRRSYGIRNDFDYRTIIRDIENGQDFLENYEGYELSLLVEIREDYAKKKEGYSNDTRYYRYDIDKIKSYIQFIQNKYYSISISGEINNYEHDSNYYRVVNEKKIRVFVDEDVDGRDRNDVIENCLNGDVFNRVVQSLVETTEYIQTLREKLKVQVRKNYMKGTNNLIIYLINEYLMEYFGNKSNQVSSIHILSSENDSFLDDIQIVEYCDKTEYFNLQTPLDTYSISSGSTCNERFWDGNMTEAFQNDITMDQIQEFYLSVMNMKYGLSSSEEDDKANFLTDFLDTVYNCGANSESYNRLGFVNTQIERNGEYTEKLYERLVTLSSNYQQYDQNIDHEEYTYPDARISVQLSDVIDNYISPNLSAKYLSAISDVYEEFVGDVTQISSSLDTIVQEYDDTLSGDLSFYFHKPSEDEYPYSFEDGQYKHPQDYYLSSEVGWDTGLVYAQDKLLRLQSFVNQETSIRNYPIIDAVECISSDLFDLSSKFMQDIVQNIQLYGYVDISSPDMTRQMDNADTFLDNKITERYTIIQGNIDNIRDSANELLSRYNTLYNNATNLLGNYFPQGLSDAWISFGAGMCKSGGLGLGAGFVGSATKGTAEHNWVFNHNDNMWYAHANAKERGRYHLMKNGGVLSRLNDSVNESLEEVLSGGSPLNTILEKFKEYLCQTTAVQTFRQVYDQGSSCLLNPIAGRNNAGTLASITSLETQLQDITDQFNKINGAYRRMIGESEYEIQPKDLREHIIELVEGVSNELFPETVYAMDTMIRTYQNYIAQIIQISATYEVLYERYRVVFEDSKQMIYLQDAKNISDLQFRCLNNLYKYATKRDASNKESLKQQIQSMIDSYNDLVEETIDLISKVQQRRTIPSVHKYTGNFLEIELENLLDFLENDVVNKYNEGMDYITRDILNIQTQQKYIMQELGSWLDTDTNFDEAVSQRIVELNFFDNDVYKLHKELFLNYYGGEYAKYPYYTFKNKEHPSYQIHPFLWNFLEYENVSEDLSYVIYNTFMEDFEPDRITEKIGKYIGDLGQVINEWKNGVFDFCGYTTGYESSDHYDRNVLTSEVVDFEGAFFPKALEEFMSNTTRSVSCLNFYLTEKTRPTVTNFSLLLAKSIMSMRDEIESVSQISNMLQERVSSYAELNLSNFGNITAITDDGNISSKVGEDVTRLQIQNCLSSMILPTFYERFYNHLNISYGDVSSEIERLCSYYDDVIELTKECCISDQYDIYRYVKDSFNNRYMLYKRYETPNPTYVDKENTLGFVWMRKNNYPFAFPAFSGTCPQIDMDTKEHCMPMLYRLERTYDGNIQHLTSDMRYFFDMGTSQDGQVLHFNVLQTDKGIVRENGLTSEQFNVDESIEQFKRFDSCAILFGYIHENQMQDRDNRTQIAIYDENSYSSVNEEFILQATEDTESRPQIVTDETVSAYTYVGYYENGQHDTYFVYANREYSPDGTVSILPSEQIRIFRHDGSNFVENHPKSCGCTIKSQSTIFENPVFDRICMAYNKKTLTLAYLGKHEGKNVLCCEGSTADDPTNDVMNSNDVLEQDVKITRATVYNSTLKVQSKTVANLNSDMSYYPLFPSLCAYVPLDEQSVDTYGMDWEYFPVQLMGKSRDISEHIAGTNTSFSPYYNYSDIKSNYEYGRVYEDYDPQSDTNITCLTNHETLYMNYEGKIVWSSYVAGKGGTRFHTGKADPQKINVIFQNINSIGKFPYYVGTLDKMYNKEFVVTEYDGVIDDEQVISDTLLHKQTISGMNPHRRYAFGTNHINGIGKIKIKFESSGDGYGQFVISFFADGTRPDRYTRVKTETIQLVVFNCEDISFFTKFHMLDTYGLMNAYDATEDVARRYVIDTDGWHIVTNVPGIDPDDESTKMWLKSYYTNRYGFSEFLEDFDVTKYSSAKDIWIYEDNKNLQFKMDDEFFCELGDDRYFYPSINKKYPKGVADLYEQGMSYYGNMGIKIDDVYDDSSVYVLSVLEKTDLADRIGRVSIKDSTYSDETVRVYEDYLLSSRVDGKVIWNYDKFDESDISNLEFVSCYIHSYENGMVDSEFDIDVEDKEMLYQLNVIQGSESYYPEISKESTVVEMDSENTDLGDFINIYASYDKNEDGSIRLYFNYFNYLDTRFVEIGDNGKAYYKTVENTYLKLDEDEDGILNVCVQIKNFNEMRQLVGEKIVTLATYHIYNISDDKPKFLMNRTYLISKDDFYMNEEHVMKISVPNVGLNPADQGVSEESRIEFVLQVYEEDNCDISEYSFEIMVPSDMIEAFAESGDCYDVTYADGVIFVNVKKQVSNIKIRCRTVMTVEELHEYVNIPYLMEPQNVISTVKAQTVGGSLTFYTRDSETALVDLPQASTEEHSFVGVINDGIEENNEIYRVT